MATAENLQPDVQSGSMQPAVQNESIERRARRDRIFLNNPVIMQGLGLAPLIMVATTVRSAWLLSLMVLLLLMPTRVLAAIFSRITPYRFRAVTYSLCAAAVFGGMFYLLGYYFESSSFVPLGIYLPLLAVDPIIIKRYERVQNERVGTALRKGIKTALGYVLVLMMMGALRELLGFGTLYDVQVLPMALMPMAQIPAGGFMMLAVLMALWRSAVNVLKRNMSPLAEEDTWEKL